MSVWAMRRVPVDMRSVSFEFSGSMHRKMPVRFRPSSNMGKVGTALHPGCSGSCSLLREPVKVRLPTKPTKRR